MTVDLIHSEQFEGQTLRLFRISNSSGAFVELSNVGAGIVRIVVPDRNGRMENVSLCYGDLPSYFGDGPCAGKTPGRYANRIAGGRFTFGDREYALPVNNGPNHLHGGPDGFANRVWDAAIEGDSVVFALLSADGDAGYPGNLTVRVTYTWSETNELAIRYHARSDADTVVNLTNHAYFNLSGADSGSVLDHEMRLYASRWLPTDGTLIPTGRLAEVEGTPMDFRQAKALGRDIKADFDALRFGKGYDNCWALDDWRPGVVTKAAELYDPASGRMLCVETTQPGVQVYTGNWLAGSPVNMSGRSYDDYDGVAIECQAFPDSPNKPQFPSTALAKGGEYEQTILFRFGTR